MTKNSNSPIRKAILSVPLIAGSYRTTILFEFRKKLSELGKVESGAAFNRL